MGKADFDDFANEYDNILKKQLAFFEKKDDYFAEYKVVIMRNTTRSDHKKILEYGCGTGRNLKYLKEHFPEAEIFGCDISEGSLSIAAKENPNITLFSLNKEKIVQKFDLILISGVLHHILPELRIDLIKGIWNLLEDRGEVFIFEHNPYNPITRHITKACPFDSDVDLIKPKDLKSLLKMSNFKIIQAHYTLFFPSFLSKLRSIEKYMGLIPMGGQYFIQAVKDL